MNVIGELRKRGIDTIDPGFYGMIKKWASWYRGDVADFHRYRIYRGNARYIKCKRRTLNMAKKVSEDIADLLMNEHTQITIEDKDTDAFVREVLDGSDFWLRANEYQEKKAALGTVAYLPYIANAETDEEGNVIRADVRISYAIAPEIYPTAWDQTGVTEAAFAFRKRWRGGEYTHIQWQHRDAAGLYVAENMVFEEKKKRAVELTPEEWNEIPFFRGMVARFETGSTEPPFVIDRLNIVNNVDIENPMGIPIYANSIDTLEKLDLEYDSYSNEFTLGRKRIFVAPELLTTSDGEPVFDPYDAVFYELPEDFFNGKEAMREVNMALRTQEHTEAINGDLNLLSFKCGFGTQYYKFDRGSVTTATQVISENSDMYRTLRKHEILLDSVLTDLIRTIIRLGIKAGREDLKEDTTITIRFDDSIIEDKEAERASDRQDVAIGVMGLPEYRSKWYGETIEVAEKKIPARDPGVLF